MKPLFDGCQKCVEKGKSNPTKTNDFIYIIINVKIQSILYHQSFQEN